MQIGKKGRSVMGIEQYDQLVSVAMSYMHALNTMDLDAYLAVFSDDCILQNPYGTVSGEAGLKQHFGDFSKIWRYFEMRADSIYPGGNDRLAIRWSVSATAQNSRTAEYSGISIFQVQGERITRVESYWDNENLQNQIQ